MKIAQSPRHPLGKNKMLRKFSFAVALAAAVMFSPAAIAGKGHGGHGHGGHGHGGHGHGGWPRMPRSCALE